MKNKILSLFVLVSLLLAASSCGTLKRIFHKDKGDTEIVMGSTQNMYQVTLSYSGPQVDSMCVVDGLPDAFKGWVQRAYMDYETNKPVIRYMYIKEMNDNFEMIYIVTPKEDMFNVSKRKVVSE